MQQSTRTATLIVAVFLSTLAGCFSLGRDTPPLEQYVLGGIPTTVDSPAERTGVTLGVRRLDLASYLATPAIVVRRGSHRVVHSEFHRWSQDPGAGINRAVASYLAAAAPVRAVNVAPWPVRTQHDFLIQLHISRFEGVAPEAPTAAEGEAHVAADWEIIRPLDGAVLARGVTDYRQRGWRVGDYAGLVSLLDTGLHSLAHELVTCIESLVSVSPGNCTVEHVSAGIPDVVRRGQSP
jgi:uncharacterized lipoprotein YmbA